MNLASDDNEDSDLYSEEEEKIAMDKLKEANDSNVTTDSDNCEYFEDFDRPNEPKRRKKVFAK